MKAVILAGGRGTRFWPASRKVLPKQFLRIFGSRTLLQETVERLKPLLSLEDIYVACGQDYVEHLQDQIPNLLPEQIIVEPMGRNTAPCIGLAALYLKQLFSEETMIVLPADHKVRDVEELHQMLRAAEEMARKGWLVTFGIRPAYPATGYGYLEQGNFIDHFQGKAAYRVARFTEKPHRATAEKFLEAGTYYWNSGMFVWSTTRILAEIERWIPELHLALQEIQQNIGNLERVREVFSRLESISIDFGVMEKARQIATLPCHLGWNDIGNWKALENILTPDDQGIVASGDYVCIDSRKSILHAPKGKMVALVGVEDLVVVDTPDALLICAANRTEDVKWVLEKIEQLGREELL